ncbi:glutathione S-transferase family protein [Motiliproteus coralliicola]|uniref:Glutathione S-transferase family protein n=1 Tax=Motiliproteus coralliicola TaxID=2283196 RepID=A0A369WCF0_9GAMM|nr:glutathione S-transferase C-terminal domain-containing protein [Motiliproteus coralliicola]RDE19011.1 glutathione S-transferase family protein [Motiliproteus coralliicola]
MLVNGHWQKRWEPVQQQDADGRFIRQNSTFSGRLEADLDAYVGRLTLYVGYICPWATRTLIARSLLGLESQVPVRVVDPVLTDYGWRFGDFPGSTDPQLEDIQYLHQLYTRTDPHYSGRATIPLLWDRQRQRIINNESADILKIFNEDLRPWHQSELDLMPKALEPDIDAFNARIYHRFNNGVYRAGFASSQQAYEEAFTEVFETLNWLETHFSQHPYAVGEQLTESDIRLFVTLSRFDVAYHGLFKTNLRRIQDYPALSAYLERLLAIEAFADNTRIDHIKAGYYSVQALNPTGIVPLGPHLPWFSYLKEGV